MYKIPSPGVRPVGRGQSRCFSSSPLTKSCTLRLRTVLEPVGVGGDDFQRRDGLFAAFEHALRRFFVGFRCRRHQVVERDARLARDQPRATSALFFFFAGTVSVASIPTGPSMSSLTVKPLRSSLRIGCFLRARRRSSLHLAGVFGRADRSGCGLAEGAADLVDDARRAKLRWAPKYMRLPSGLKTTPTVSLPAITGLPPAWMAGSSFRNLVTSSPGVIMQMSLSAPSSQTKTSPEGETVMLSTPLSGA